MKNLTSNRGVTRSAWLPTAVVWLALGAGFASVGQAETTPLTDVTTTANRDVETTELRDAMRAEAHKAVKQTRISVSADLDARLDSQQEPLRLAESGKR